MTPEKVDIWQTGCLGSRANQESCQRGFSLEQQEAGQQCPWWWLFSLADIQAGRAGWAPWHWKWSRHSGGVVAGTSSRLASPVVRSEITHAYKHTHTHSATLLLRSKQWLVGRAALEKLPLSGDGFHVNGSLNRRCVTALVACWAPSDPLLLSFN